MLSVLIPVYNFDVTDLVNVLNKQCLNAGISYEIILLDDASDETFKKGNRKLKSVRNVIYRELDKNIGRSKIRNKLAVLASYPYLLFLDCDSKIGRRDFIENYLSNCNGRGVVCGGLNYSMLKPEMDDQYLRWTYGHYREYKSVCERQKNPNASFSSFNFLISKSIFDRIRFNEDLKSYGHEDTLFGYELMKNNIIIKHIENPVIHIGLETNEQFIEKTREGIKNLKRIMKINGNEKRLMRDITILWYYKLFKKLRLRKLAEFIYRKAEKKLYNNLTGKQPKLLYFDLYKLGYLCSLNGEIK